MKLYKYNNQVFLYIDQGCYTQVLLNGKIVFGKLTAIDFKKYNYEVIRTTDTIYIRYQEWFNYLKKNHAKYSIVWNLTFKNYRYNVWHGQPYIRNVNYSHEPWNLVCGHISSYRSNGSRIEDSSWKLAVKGLDCNEFRAIRDYHKIKNETI